MHDRYQFAEPREHSISVCKDERLLSTLEAASLAHDGFQFAEPREHSMGVCDSESSISQLFLQALTQARTLTDTSAACRLRLSLLIMACELLQQIVLSMSSHSSHCQKTSRISKHDGPVKLCCLTDTEIGELARPSAFGPVG